MLIVFSNIEIVNKPLIQISCSPPFIETTEETLKELFGEYGPLLKIKIKDKATRPYAFIQYQVSNPSIVIPYYFESV